MLRIGLFQEQSVIKHNQTITHCRRLIWVSNTALDIYHQSQNQNILRNTKKQFETHRHTKNDDCCWINWPIKNKITILMYLFKVDISCKCINVTQFTCPILEHLPSQTYFVGLIRKQVGIASYCSSVTNICIDYWQLHTAENNLCLYWGGKSTRDIE